MRKDDVIEDLILKDLYRPGYLRPICPGIDFRRPCRRMFRMIGRKFDPRWIFEENGRDRTWTKKQRKKFSRWHVGYLMREKGLEEGAAKFVDGCFLDDFGFEVSDGVSDDRRSRIDTPRPDPTVLGRGSI